MRPFMISSLLLVLTASFLSPIAALRAISSSPCASKCGNVLDSTTGVDDISCHDRDFGSVAKANTLSSCVTCQLESKYVDPVSKQTDLHWAIYNLRYAVSWCLFGYPNNTEVGTSPCITRTACGDLENAFEFDSLSPNATTYGFCPLLSLQTVPKCTSCTAQGDNFFVTNYITALTAACEQQPIPGGTIFIEGNLFSRTRTNITSATSAPDSHHEAKTPAVFPLGAKVGVAVAGIVVLLSLLGCCIVWRGKQRRRKVLQERQRQSGYADWVSAQVTQQRSPNPMHSNLNSATSGSRGHFFDSPVSTRNVYGDRTWGSGIKEDDSPHVQHGGEKPYFSPYSSHYSSPVSATEQVQVVAREWPTDRMMPGMVPGRPPTRSRSCEKKDVEAQGERIEMQNVAPVLLQPQPGHFGLSKSDGRGGHAF